LPEVQEPVLEQAKTSAPGEEVKVIGCQRRTLPTCWTLAARHLQSPRRR